MQITLSAFPCTCYLVTIALWQYINTLGYSYASPQTTVVLVQLDLLLYENKVSKKYTFLVILSKISLCFKKIKFL